MFPLLIGVVLIGVVYVTLVNTLFKKSKCTGAREMNGKTVIITGKS